MLDLSSAQGEYAALMYPVAQVLEWDNWQDGFDEHWAATAIKVRDEFRTFKCQVLDNFKGYYVPVTTLDRSTLN